MPDLAAATHIAVMPGVAGGHPHVAGRRIKVRDIVFWHEQLGRSADEIGAEFDINLAEVYAALSYYFDHRAEVDAEIADRDTFVADLRQRSSSLLERKLSALSGD